MRRYVERHNVVFFVKRVEFWCWVAFVTIKDQEPMSTNHPIPNVFIEMLNPFQSQCITNCIT
jgi:hypothetical protein